MNDKNGGGVFASLCNDAVKPQTKRRKSVEALEKKTCGDGQIGL